MPDPKQLREVLVPVVPEGDVLDRATARYSVCCCYQNMSGILAEARWAGVERVVQRSGGSAGSGDMKYAITRYMVVSETAARDSGLPWTIIRPSAFMSNTLLPARSSDGRPPTPQAFNETSRRSGDKASRCREVTPFRMEVPEVELRDLRERLEPTRWPEAEVGSAAGVTGGGSCSPSPIAQHQNRA